MWYLEDHPERATALTDDQRDQVKVGDVVQFDWDDSGDRDHTGIVTAVITEADGSITIEYAGHTDATWDRSVDWAITEHAPRRRGVLLEHPRVVEVGHPQARLQQHDERAEHDAR